MSWYPITTLVAGIFVLSIASFTYLKGRRDLATRLFSLFCLVVAFWCFSDFAVNVSGDMRLALVMTRFLHIGAVFTPPLFIHFILSLTNTRSRWHTLRFAYAASGLCLLFNLTPLFIREVVSDPIRGFSSVPGSAYGLFLGLFAWGAVYGFYKFVPAYRESTVVKRTQLKYIFAGLLIVIAGGVSYFLLNIGTETDLPPIDNLLVIAFTSIIAYAMVRHRLMDVNIVLTRAVIFVLFYIPLLFVPVIFGSLLQPVLESWWRDKWWTAPTLFEALVAVCGLILFRYIQQRTEDRLLAEQRRYQATLRQASQGMTQVRDLDRLLRLIVHVVTKAVQLTHGAIFLKTWRDEAYSAKVSRDKDRIPLGMAIPLTHPLVKLLQESEGPLVTEELELMLSHVEAGDDGVSGAIGFLKKRSIALVVPSFVEAQLLGFLALGLKRSGQPFTQEDIGVFSTLANQAALAVENALFFEELKTTQAQLFQSEKLATMGQLASSMAHEIHNPLAVISGEAQLLLAGNQPQDPQTKEFLQDIVKQCKRAEEITDRLLNFSRGAKSTQPTLLDMNEVLVESLKLVEHQVRMESITLVKQLAEALPAVKGNRTQIQEIFLNLALNACQAMKEREGARLEVATRRNGKFVEVSFADTGPGISPENLRRIFDPFFTTKATGTGLGLFICDRIIREHRGKIQVESEVGKGTTFTVKLPLAEESAEQRGTGSGTNAE